MDFNFISQINRNWKCLLQNAKPNESNRTRMHQSCIAFFFFFNIIIFYFDKIILQNYLQIMNSASMFMCRLLVFLGLMMQLNE